jgi:hypothetical protein
MPRGGRQKGADSYKLDKVVVPMLHLWCSVAKTKADLSPVQAIRFFVTSHPNIVLLLGGRRARKARTEKQRDHVVEAIVYRLYGKMVEGRYEQHVLSDEMHRFWRFVSFEFDPGVADIVAGLEATSAALKSNRKSSKSK